MFFLKMCIYIYSVEKFNAMQKKTGTKMTKPYSFLSCEVGVSSIFLRVHRSKNAIHKPTHTFGVKMVNKKYVFNYYRYFLF
jgi:hypothetical protein